MAENKPSTKPLMDMTSDELERAGRLALDNRNHLVELSQRVDKLTVKDARVLERRLRDQHRILNAHMARRLESIEAAIEAVSLALGNR